MQIFLLLLTLLIQHRSCDWVSEWHTPIRMQYKVRPDHRNQMLDTFKLLSPQNIEAKDSYRELSNELFTKTKLKLGSTLKSTRELSDILNRQIREIELKEKYLKEVIFHGRSGVTIMSIWTTVREPRTYIIRDGYWSICSGLLQPAAPAMFLQDIMSTPTCIGHEVPSVHDACVFNSVIKYETIPTERRGTYEEDNFLCLKPNFNNTLEQYQSVPWHVVNDTCKKGVIKGLKENLMKCGVRVLTEYNYYPDRNELPAGLRDYCARGVCKMTVAWYLSNSSIEHFQVLSDDSNFKRTFLKMGSF